MKMKPFTNKVNKKVFLGGTCNGSTWRDSIIPLLKIDYFNPVVENWTESDYKIELQQREICDFVLYVITPKMKGIYSICEVIEDSIKHPDKTILCVLFKDEDTVFDEAQIKSFDAMKKMVINNNATVCTDLNDVVNFLNNQS